MFQHGELSRDSIFLPDPLLPADGEVGTATDQVSRRLNLPDHCHSDAARRLTYFQSTVDVETNQLRQLRTSPVWLRGGLMWQRRSEFLPLIPADMGLAYYSCKEISSDISSVGIGYPNRSVLSGHKLMSSPRIGSFKSSKAQIMNQVLPPDWPKSRHQATSCISSSIPSTMGSGKFL